MKYFLLFGFVTLLSALQLSNCFSDGDSFSHLTKYGDKKIKMTIFYATQCPYCNKFFKEQYQKLFYKKNNDVYKSIEFDLVPFIENVSKDHGKWNYECMHGQDECEYSKLHACVLNNMNNLSITSKTALKFLGCIQASKIEDPDQCAKKYGYPLDSIREKCVENEDLVGELMLKYADRSKNNDPPVNFVPWIQFNDKFDESVSEKAETNLIETICNQYDGTKPRVCKHYGNSNYIKTTKYKEHAKCTRKHADDS